MRYSTTFALAFLIGTSLLSGAAVQAAPQQSAATADAKSTSPAVVNLNTASAQQLEGLPGIGPKTAALIVEYRQKNGAFKKIEELMNVKGIGEKSFLKLKPQISVAPASGAPTR